MKLFYTQRLFKASLFIAIFSLFSTACYSQSDLSPDTYSIQIHRTDPKKALVTCEITVLDSLLYMSPIGANQFPDRWAKFVHQIEAESLEGKQLKIDSLQGAQWKVHSPINQRIKLRYEIHLDHEDYNWNAGVDGAAYAREWGVFYTGRSIFIMSGHHKTDLKVSFKIPHDWKVSTPWEIVDTEKNTFRVLNQTTLSNSILFAGTHKEFVINRDGFKLIFALGGKEVLEQSASFFDMAEGVLDYYIALMGGVPNPSPDNKFKSVLLVMNSSSQTDGEVIGNNISILLEKDGDHMSQLMARFMFAHEFFHLWNGKSFTPEDEQCEWFKEGVTNYYTLKSLYHIGYLNEQGYLGAINNFFYQRYHNDEGTGKISLTQGDQKHDHWGLIYSGGLFAGISQDMIIRTTTNNEKSMDNVMRTLFKKFGGTHSTYTLKDLEDMMSAASGNDQTGFFRNYIKGYKRIPLDHYLNLGGFEAKESNGSISIFTKEERSFMEQQINNGLFGIN